MKKIYTLSLILLLSVKASILFGQNAGDYRSIVSGSWFTPANWETYDGVAWGPAVVAPTAVDGVITIQAGTTINYAADNINLDQVVVDSTATLTFFSALLTIENGPGNDMEVAGTLEISGETFIDGLGYSIS